jgi:uncharacterized cupin superfamily protein
MPTIIKPDSLVFKEDPSSLEDFKLKTITPRLGEICGSKHFLFDIRQLDPGRYSFPYHFHRNAEELMMIISGSFTLRSKEGLSIINAGELVFFEIGETGVHQFYNHTDVPCIYLDIRSTIGIDITEYPDSGKINILTFREVFEKSSKVEYNKGEEHIRQIWDKLKKDDR